MSTKAQILISRIQEKFKIIVRFMGFWIKAKSIDSVDSPQIYKLCCHLLDKNAPQDIFNQIEKRRQSLKRDQTIINRESLGASSTIHQGKLISISQIATSSVSPRVKCHILYKIVSYANPKKILELGTSLAISTAYLSAVNSVQYIDTVEGSSAIYAFNNKSPAHQKIRFHHMSFQSFIDQQKKHKERYDCIILDGHHEEQATLSYVYQCQELLYPEGFIIIDDIYWSAGMMNAWIALKQNTSYNLKLDLFYFGMLSTKKSIKDHIDIKLWPYTMRWQLGLFR